MIADLKADSERWDAERRQTASRGQPSNGTTQLRDSNGIVRKSNTPVVEYRASTTHQSRQYYGPTEAAPGPTVGGYPSSATAGNQQGVYDNAPQYQQTYAQPSPGYGAATQNYPQDNYYVAGADMAVDTRGIPRPAVPQAATTPRTGAVQYAPSNSTYQTGQPDSRTAYYSSQTPVSAAQQYTSQQPADPFYGRGAYNQPPFSKLYFFISEMKNSNSLAHPSTGTYSDSTPDMYDNRYAPDPSPTYNNPPPISTTSSTTATSGSSRRERSERDERSRHGNRRH